MAVTSMLDYWDADIGTEGGWNQIALSNLAEVEYIDEVYKPARLLAKIQNAQAAGGQAQTGISHNGGTPMNIANTGHGLHTGNRISVTVESTDTLERRVYLVTYVDDDNFTLKHFGADPLTGVRHSGADLDAVAGNGTSGTLAYVPLGEYSIETPEVAKPDFYLGQNVVLWQVPETFSKSSGVSHDGNATLITVTHTSHPFVHNDIVQFVDESTGVIEDREYKISYINSNSYNLRSTLNSNYIGGNGTAGTISTYFETKTVGFPIFNGTITSLQEDWNGTYGKTITLEAKDHLQFLDNTTAQKIIRTVSKGQKFGTTDVRLKAAEPDLVYLGSTASGTPTTENKFSEAVKRIVTDFTEGRNVIYTDNTSDGSTAFDSDGKKLEDSSFVLTANELQTGIFEKNLSETNYKILRILRDLGMSDRHTTTGLSGTVSYGTGSPMTCTDFGHGLTENMLIAVTGDRTSSDVHNDPPVVHNGIYRVRTVTTNNFELYTMDGTVTTGRGVTGKFDYEGVEDGNFGYDFFLDSGVYGQPGQTGMSVAGGTEIPYRPHLNYFKRGYRQFRPDATGLNITLPAGTDAAEDGQTRIMYPDASYRVGEEEVITAIDLQASNEGEGDKNFIGSLGHRMELMRIKQIACKDNVASLTTESARSAFAGTWYGQFHWGRHDSLVAKAAGLALPGMNDTPMLYDVGGTSSLGTGADNASFWVGARSDIGATYWDLVHARIFEGANGSGNNGVGGFGVTGDADQTRVAGGGFKISGYSGLSELPAGGRVISIGPGEAGYATARGLDTSVAVATTGVVDCDLIKSLKNVINEELWSDNDDGTSTTSNTGGDVVVNSTAHGLLTGAWVKIRVGTMVNASNVHSNIYRVEYIDADSFYLTRLPYEAYMDIPSHGMSQEDIYASGARIAYTDASQATKWRKVYNVFDGVCRIQYQTMNSRTEKAFTENFLIISDRIREDVPHMGVEIAAISNRVSSDTSLSGISYAPATVPDATLYPGSGGSGGLEQDEATVSSSVKDTVKVRFRKGDKVSESRFISHTDSGSSTIHYFKNTQAIITENFLFDKNRNKSQELNYSYKGSDMNEVRRTAAAFLTRSSRDLVRGSLRIVRFPFIKLTGQALASSTGPTLKATQNVLVYGGRPGMLVTKVDSSDGTFVAGVLAENISTDTITGTLSGGNTWAEDDYFRMYVHLRAGHSVRVEDPRSSIQANMICTKIAFREGPGVSQCDMEVIGLKDVAMGFAVKPLGSISGAIDNSRQPGPITPLSIGKARLDGITFSSGTL